MKITKFTDFIREEIINDTPEQYVATALGLIKKSVDSAFFREEGVPAEEGKSHLEDIGVRLESSEISKYSKLNDTLTVKFSDDEATYSLIFTIGLSEAIPQDKTKTFTHKAIKNCYIKFKKYDIDTFDITGQLNKNIEILWPKSKSDELQFEIMKDESDESAGKTKVDAYELLVYLKNEFEEGFEEGGEGLGIETE